MGGRPPGGWCCRSVTASGFLQATLYKARWGCDCSQGSLYVPLFPGLPRRELSGALHAVRNGLSRAQPGVTLYVPEGGRRGQILSAPPLGPPACSAPVQGRRAAGRICPCTCQAFLAAGLCQDAKILGFHQGARSGAAVSVLRLSREEDGRGESSSINPL